MSLFSLDNDESSMLTPLTPAQFAVVAEPDKTFLLNQDQLPRASHTTHFLQTLLMNEATAPVTSNHGSYDEPFNVLQTPNFPNSITPQSGHAPSRQPQPDDNTTDETTRDDEEDQEGESSEGKVKKKGAPRYDLMYKCVSCNTKDMERSGANKHILKFHEGSTFWDVMVRQPNKWR